MKYQFIKKYSNEFKIARICRVLEVKRSSYYAWIKRPECERKKETRLLLAKIKEIYKHSGKRYGSPKILDKLKEKGYQFGHNRV